MIYIGIDPGKERVCLSLHIPAVPVAQPRPRASNRHGVARVHQVVAIKQADGTSKPHPILAFKATVRLAAQQAYQGPPMEGPLSVSLVFVMPRPKALCWKKRPMPRLRHIGKPDRDNLDKSVLDALKGLLWKDDSQICHGVIEKWIAAGDEQPHVTIVVEELEQAEAAK